MLKIFEKISELVGCTKKDVPRDGMIAKEQGFDLSDNPFKMHTADHSIWRDDWLFSSRRFR